MDFKPVYSLPRTNVAIGGALRFEIVYVINTPQQRMIAYRFNATTNQIDVFQGVDLSEIRAEGGGKQQQPKRRGRRRP